jgi:GTPase-activating protein SAC7
LSGSEKRIKELKTIFDSPDRYGKGLVWDGYTVHDAANLLRRYLNDLPEPVVPLDLYEKFREPLRGATKAAVGDAEGPQFVDNFDMDGAIRRYQQLITELPPLNRQLLLYILDLLAVFAAKADENRMTSQNLAAIFQPGMLSHPAHAMAPEEYRLNQCVIIFLIENQDHFLIGMQGTAADEKTVQEVQKGTPANETPSTPVAIQKSGVSRSASNASAGAENVAREGQLRRNQSTSSRHSKHSNGGPSPSSPALGSTPTGGLGRSNTVPSKKSPGLQSGRFHPRGANTPPIGPLTPVTNETTPSRPTVVEEVQTPSEQEAAGIRAVGTQERMLEPPVEAATPSRERNLHNLFQRSPSGDTSERRQPKKLQKRRVTGSANPSAQSSTTSLTHPAGVSPAVETSNPLEQVVVAAPVEPAGNPTAPAPGDGTSEQTPRAVSGQSNTLQPPNADSSLKPKESQATSLHSSFNEGSDLDRAEETNPNAEQPDKERKRRWRLSRRREDSDSTEPRGGMTSPRRAVETNTIAEGSATSIGADEKRPRKSFTTETADPNTLSNEALVSQDSAGKDSKEDGSRGLTGWIKHKYREAKESRNKSPPADRALSPGSSGRGTHGRSLEIRRAAEEEKPDAAPAVPQIPAQETPTPKTTQ